MSTKKRPRTTVVEDAQIVAELEDAEAPSTAAPGGEASAVPQPPVRERARTEVYERPKPIQPPGAEAPDLADASADSPPLRRTVGRAAHRAIVEHCPLALFQIDPLGNLLWANEPCAEFLREPISSVLGKPIGDTRLGVVYADLMQDVRAMASQSSPPTVKQVLCFEEPGGITVMWLCWLAAETNPFGDVLRIFGYLHPYGSAPTGVRMS